MVKTLLTIHIMQDKNILEQELQYRTYCNVESMRLSFKKARDGFFKNLGNFFQSFNGRYEILPLSRPKLSEFKVENFLKIPTSPI